MAFDALPLTSLDVSFEDRYGDLTTKIGNNHPFIVSQLFYIIPYCSDIFDSTNTVTFRVLCSGLHHMRAFADEVIQKGGGEGLILRRVASQYEPGRTLSLLKLKVISFILFFLFFVF